MLPVFILSNTVRTNKCFPSAVCRLLRWHCCQPPTGDRQLPAETILGTETNYRDTTFSALIRKSDEEIAAEEEKSGGKKKIDNPGIDPIANREEGEALVERIKDLPFIVTNVGKKDGKEYAPRLFDLTSLQVECNKKFAYSADETLKLIQSLYEKKVATYPRVDTTFLSDDIYPKCPGILKGLRDYEVLTLLWQVLHCLNRKRYLIIRR